MSIYFHTFMHKTPIENLQAFLNGVSSVAFADVDWYGPRRSLVDTLAGIIRTLEDGERDRVYSDIDRVGQFTSAHGRRMLRSVLLADPDLLERFDALEDINACALFIMEYDAQAFENALSALYAQRLLNGRDWTGFNFEPDGEPRLKQNPPLADLEAELRDIFATDGPVPRVVVDRFARHEPDPAGSGMLTREQFTIYVEAAPEAELVFIDGTSVEPRIVRHVQEGALLFDPAERMLDIVAKGGGKDRRRRIAEAFVTLMLEPGVELAQRSRRTLALNVLKHRPVFEVRPEDKVRSIEVARLTLGAPDYGAIATFEVPSRGPRSTGGDLYAQAERVFGRDGILARPAWPVIGAKLRIMFEPERPHGRAKLVTFELKAPDRTNLRDQIELHRRIADTLLARWGLYAAE